MSGFYPRINATATRLITKYGRTVTMVKVTDGTPADATKPWIPGPNDTAEFVTTAVFEKMQEGLVDGSVILMTDEIMSVAVDLGAGMTMDQVWSAKDYVRDGSSVCSIVKVMPIEPGPDTVMLQIIVRRGP